MTNFLIFPHFVTEELQGPNGKVFFGRPYSQDMKENQIQLVLVHQDHVMTGRLTGRSTGQSEALQLLKMPGTAMSCVSLAGKQVFNLDYSQFV